MSRKPVLAKVREKVLATLPHLSDEDLAHIASLCDGLLKLRAQQKQSALQPKFTIRTAQQAIGVDLARSPDHTAVVTVRKEDDGSLTVVDAQEKESNESD